MGCAPFFRRCLHVAQPKREVWYGLFGNLDPPYQHLNVIQFSFWSFEGFTLSRLYRCPTLATSLGIQR